MIPYSPPKRSEISFFEHKGIVLFSIGYHLGLERVGSNVHEYIDLIFIKVLSIYRSIDANILRELNVYYFRQIYDDLIHTIC